MTKDLNKVLIIGRLMGDPDMRTTTGNGAMTTFRVATMRQWRDQSGEQHEETEVFHIVAWNKLAEICQQQLSRNARVFVEGRLQTRTWDDHYGNPQVRVEVVANEVIILDRPTMPRDLAQQRPWNPAITTRSEPDYDIPSGPVASLEIGDDDIPA